ncbi:mucolipin-3 [Eurytemora carolleeae]|uniref:mucolipin-3 n=1 Tax=Eurytemora carolleeae TaxID=1294199 RepID=UPI000C76A84C|nr:mucolipin-3 [Eurytemora carolleeae]|eukprot:XP_023347695.1 mucolipin-3-like [Eurytemora affinis]
MGAYESEEEIVFSGLSNRRPSDSGFEPLILPPPGPSSEEEKIKRKLKFFFMNPRDKFIATRQIPWKLLLQIIKVVLVTLQLWIFAEFRYAHVNYYSDQTVALEHFFIKDWDQVREVHAYPPSTGKMAFYKKSEFYDFLDNAIIAYRSIEDEAVGPFFRNSSIQLCIQQFKTGSIKKDLQVKLDREEKTICLELKENELDGFKNSSTWFHQNNFTMPWHALQSIELAMNLTSVTLKPLGPVPTPDCFKLKVVIRLDNAGHDGQLPVKLSMVPVRLDCPSEEESSSTYSSLVVSLNLVVIFLCLSSLLLCLRALLRAQILKHETDAFFRRNYDWSLSVNEGLEFLNLWYVMICTNDCLIVLGSIIKQLIESKSVIGDMWDICSLLLGTGNLLVWFGLLRYLGFFKTYNVLILTMKGAAPNMLRFLICASFIYIGFVFAGWVILGPYHFKFESIMSTSECLFSLINGDDMFATFMSIPRERSVSVWVYSRVYLYTFICLFIYVVLSLFISIIMDTYEIIKNCYERGFPANRLEQFYCTSEFDFKSGQYQGESVVTRVWTLLRTHIPSPRSRAYEQIS